MHDDSTMAEGPSFSSSSKNKSAFTRRAKKVRTSADLANLAKTAGVEQQSIAATPRTSFMDIPLELRIHIYQLTFKDIVRHSNTIAIQVVHHDRDGKKWSELYQAKPDQNFNTKRKGRVYNARTHKWDAIPAPTAILATCKQIYSEAAGVPYGTRTYRFHNLKEMKFIIPYLGEGVKHLKSIEIDTGGYTKKHAQAAFAGLSKCCTNLRTVRLPHDAFCAKARGKPVTMKQLCKDTLPLYGALHKSYKDNNLVVSCLDMLKIADEVRSEGPGGYRSLEKSCGCGYLMAIQKDKELEEELKDLVAVSLGLQRPEQGDGETGE